MEETTQSTETAEASFWSWLRFWVELAILSALAIIGAFFASADAAPGDYQSGMILMIAAVVLGFVQIKYRLDGGGEDWVGLLCVERLAELWIVLPLLAILAFAGLLIAHAWPAGSLYDAGLGLCVVSLLLGFLNIKNVFDRLDSGTH